MLFDGDVLLNACLWQSETYEASLVKFYDKLAESVEGCFGEKYILALGPLSGKNFRDEMYPDYKQTTTRVKGRDNRPDFYPLVKKYIAELEETAVADGIEADDLLGHWVTDCRKYNIPYVIATNDKDLDQLPGPHYNIRRAEYYYVEEEEALRFFLQQMIQGDTVDRIPGLPKYGPVKAKTYLDQKGWTADAVIALYQEHYGEKWLMEFLANGKLLFIQRHEGDWFSLKRFRELCGE